MRADCCRDGDHSPNETAATVSARQPAKKYFCPMCEGVESNTPGGCPKCGMALEPNPTFREKAKTIYTCPMHPQIEQDHPGSCPICGMTLEPKNVVANSDDENAELRDMTRRFWIGQCSACQFYPCDVAPLPLITGMGAA